MWSATGTLLRASGGRTKKVIKWELEWGEHIETLQNAAKKLGKVPSALKNRPELPEELELFYNGFVELSMHRTSNGMGPNPISITEISTYCELHNITDTALFARYIRACDRALLEHVASK